MSCSLKRLSSEDSISQKDEKTQIASEDDYVPPSDNSISSTTDGDGSVPPSDKSNTSTVDDDGDGAATSTLSDSNDLGKFCFCRSTVVINSP